MTRQGRPSREYDEKGKHLGPTKYRHDARDALGNPLCGAGLERGLFCRRQPNHEGEHQELGGGRAWPGEDPV